MKFNGCKNCEYMNESYIKCFNVCGKPLDILIAVEYYYNKITYPEDLEVNLYNIVESEHYISENDPEELDHE